MPTCCQVYCLGLSAFSTFFLFYLGVLIAIDSETIYFQVNDNASSAVALFVSSLIYGGITAYVYYNTFMNVDREQELKRWIKERNHETEMHHLDSSAN